jgi:hypothetical protein
VKKLRRDTSDPDAGGLDGQNLVHAAVPEQTVKLLSNFRKKGNVHLVVQKAVHLEHVRPFDHAILTDALFQKFHGSFRLS